MFTVGIYRTHLQSFDKALILLSISSKYASFISLLRNELFISSAHAGRAFFILAINCMVTFSSMPIVAEALRKSERFFSVYLGLSHNDYPSLNRGAATKV